jgi:hypothetical protein
MTFASVVILMAFGLPVLGGVVVFVWSEIRNRKQISSNSLPVHNPMTTIASDNQGDSKSSPSAASAQGAQETKSSPSVASNNAGNQIPRGLST